MLAAVLTVRVGLAAQAECRLVPLTAAERREGAAGVLSALTGFLARPAPDSRTTEGAGKA